MLYMDTDIIPINKKNEKNCIDLPFGSKMFAAYRINLGAVDTLNVT